MDKNNFKKHPEILALWNEYREARNSFWIKIARLNDIYNAKYDITLKIDDLGDVCGINTQHNAICGFDLEDITVEAK